MVQKQGIQYCNPFESRRALSIFAVITLESQRNKTKLSTNKTNS